MILLAASLLGLLLFIWPFLGLQPPPSTPALLTAVGVLAALGIVESGARRLDARRFALLAIIAALDSVLRAYVVVGVGGFSPVFFLILCAGFAYGPSFGFLAGASALLCSALVTGGVGPWLPYQLFAAGWVGAAAGLLPRPAKAIIARRKLLPLAAVGVMMGFAFGALMDVWDWTYFRGSPGLGWAAGMPAPEALRRFGVFYLTTSAAYDSFRAAGNALAILVLGAPVVSAMLRYRARLQFEQVPAAEV